MAINIIHMLTITCRLLLPLHNTAADVPRGKNSTPLSFSLYCITFFPFLMCGSSFFNLATSTLKHKITGRR